METIEKLKEQFIDFCLKQESARNEGCGKKSNYYHKKIVNLYKQIKKLGYLDIFKSLLDYENENVQIWAAVFCLRICPKEVKAVLNNLKKSSNPMTSIEARSILESFNDKIWDKLYFN